MKNIHTFIENAVEDMKVGDESWRVKALIAIYALGGAVITNMAILTSLG